jgi:hypothetical protein
VLVLVAHVAGAFFSTADTAATCVMLSLHAQARMWLAGGGYIGTKGNNVVENMICK